MKTLFAIAVFLLPVLTLAQIKTPATPTFQKFSSDQHYYFNGASATGNDHPDKPHYPMGAHANDIIAEQNARAMQQMGVKRPVVPPAGATQQREFIMNQYRQQQADEIQEIISELNEMQAVQQKFTNSYYNSANFKTGNEAYLKAKNVLSNMLTGTSPLSLKDAFYVLEKAYGNTHLTYEDYNSVLKRSSQFIKQWLNQQGHSITDNNALHFGIQSFLHDTLTVTKTILEPNGYTTTKHLPFAYDYVDFRAEEDFRNYFVTKTLATGFGQCNSLPATYLLLAEQLGAKAYLSYAPLHSFIKFPDSKGVIHNYEPTSHFQISDQWYAQHLNITAAAYRNRIYLDTLNKKQIIAGAMMDLAYGYLRKHGMADGVFIDACVNEAIQYFPGGVANVQGWLLRSSLLTARLHIILQKNQIRDLSEIERSPQALEVYKQLLGVQQVLQQLGYQELPANLYESLMQQQEARGVQQQQQVNTKLKRNLFTDIK